MILSYGKYEAKQVSGVFFSITVRYKLLSVSSKVPYQLVFQVMFNWVSHVYIAEFPLVNVVFHFLRLIAILSKGEIEDFNFCEFFPIF